MLNKVLDYLLSALLGFSLSAGAMAAVHPDGPDHVRCCKDASEGAKDGGQ